MTREMWQGVLPAITTPFDTDGGVDHEFLAGHARRLVAAGCRGVVALGSLGEGATLTVAEKIDVLKTLVAAVGDRVPVVAGIAALSTDDATYLARAADKAGCRGLMVLPPYVYKGDWHETRAHVSAIITATTKSGGQTWGGDVFFNALTKNWVALDTFQLRDRKAKALFAEPAGGGRLAQQIVKDTGIRLEVLDPLETGELKPDAYVQGMRRNATALVKALQ